MKVTEEIRREVITATGLCLNPKCVAHDVIVARIWEYRAKAYAEGFKSARDRCTQDILSLGF